MENLVRSGGNRGVVILIALQSLQRHQIEFHWPEAAIPIGAQFGGALSQALREIGGVWRIVKDRIVIGPSLQSEVGGKVALQDRARQRAIEPIARLFSTPSVRPVGYRWLAGRTQSTKPVARRIVIVRIDAREHQIVVAVSYTAGELDTGAWALVTVAIDRVHHGRDHL